MAAKVNVYVMGNRVRVRASFTTDPDDNGVFDTATDPSTVYFIVRNLADDSKLEWHWDGGTWDDTPVDVNEEHANPATGEWEVLFDIDSFGERLVYVAGTGACKTAGKKKFVVTRSDAA